MLSHFSAALSTAANLTPAFSICTVTTGSAFSTYEGGEPPGAVRRAPMLERKRRPRQWQGSRSCCCSNCHCSYRTSGESPKTWGRGSLGRLDVSEEAVDLPAQRVRLLGKAGRRFQHVTGGIAGAYRRLADAADIGRDAADHR
jgi:hypothetical protein